MHMRVLKMIFLCCFLVVLAGCGTIDSDIEIDNDFKGKWEATVDIGGEKSKEEIIQFFEKSLQTTAVNEEGKLLKETGEAEEIESYANEFIKLEPLDANGRVISSKDDSVKSSTWRVTAIFQNEKELLNAYRIIYSWPFIILLSMFLTSPFIDNDTNSCNPNNRYKNSYISVNRCSFRKYETYFFTF